MINKWYRHFTRRAWNTNAQDYVYPFSANVYNFSSHPNDLVSCEFRPLDGQIRDKSTRERMIMFFLPLYPDSFDRLARQPPPPTHGQTHKHARIHFFFFLKIHKVVVVHSPHSLYCIHTHTLSKFLLSAVWDCCVAHLAAMIIHFIFLPPKKQWKSNHTQTPSDEI
jgi:hypothetical protein